MTDYEEIRETLDHCVQRLSQIPAEKEQAVSSQATLRARITQKQKEDRDNAARLLESRERVKILEQDFRGEYELGYVPRQFAVTEDLADQAQKVVRQIGGNASLRNFRLSQRASGKISRKPRISFGLCAADEAHPRP